MNTAIKVRSVRYYVAKDKATDKPVALVEAANPAQARSHMARKTFTVHYAEQSDVMAAVLAGIKPEAAIVEATDEDEGE